MLPGPASSRGRRLNTRFRVRKRRHDAQDIGDGFRILDDAEVMLASKGDSRLPIPLRRIRVKRDKGGVITLITNDLKRTAVEIAALYKGRWQIELLFRWIKQHLDIRKFLGNNDNAIRLQILAAMIAYLLLRIAARVELPQNAAAALRRTRLPAPVHAKADRQNRQTSPRQSQQANAKILSRPNGVLLCLIFPGQPCPTRGRGLRRLSEAKPSLAEAG